MSVYLFVCILVYTPKRKRRGPVYKEEKEGTGIASNVVKVKGENPVTPGCPREDRVRRYVSDSKS